MNECAFSAINPDPRLNLTWITSWGKPLPLGWTHISEWTWKSRKGKLPYPVLRTWIRIPDDLELIRIEGSGFSWENKPDDAPIGGQVVSIDLTTVEPVAPKFFFKKHNGTERISSLSMILLANRPSILIHPNCIQTGIEIKKLNDQVKHHYTGAYCREVGNDLHLYVFHSPDSTWQKVDFGRKEKKEGNNWKKYEFSEAELPTTSNAPVGFYTVQTSGANTAQYAIVRNFIAERETRLNATAGLSPTLLNYREDPTNINLTTTALTGKAGATYKLIPNAINLDFSIFGTLHSLTQSPSGTTKARYLGINGRVGYQFPLGLKSYSIHTLLGWYYWSMLVSDQSYGVQGLAGPQIFLMLKNRPKLARGFWAYLKYAPVASGVTSYSLFSNYEIAIGGGYQISEPKVWPIWNATLDVARTTFALPNIGNALRLLAVSAGISLGL